MAAEWTDLVDPTRDQILAAIATPLPEDALELLAAPPREGRPATPLLQGHGRCVLAVLSLPVPAPEKEEVEYLELDLLATRDAVVTIRKRSPGGTLAPVDGVAARADAHGSAAALFQAALDDAADAFLELLDGLYGSIDYLEGDIETLSGVDVRRRIAALRNDLLQARRATSATRGIARRIVDGRVDVESADLFPPDVESKLVDTYDTLVRATEELDVARDLLAGVRDYYQAKVAEQQNEVAKTLTVIASLVLVPSFIVGFYGQNFEGAFDDAYWTMGVSLGLIVATTLVQLVLFRLRRWI